MKTLSIVEGDIEVDGTGYVFKRGAAKLKQDLGHALTEQFGHDRFHPRWGSVLMEQIGKTNSRYAHGMLKAECERVVANYMLVQRTNIDRDISMGRKPAYDAGEIIIKVTQILIQQQMDQAIITIQLLTMSREQISIEGAVNLMSGTIAGWA